MALNRPVLYHSRRSFEIRVHLIQCPLRRTVQRFIPFDERVSLGSGFLIQTK